MKKTDPRIENNRRVRKGKRERERRRNAWQEEEDRRPIPRLRWRVVGQRPVENAKDPALSDARAAAMQARAKARENPEEACPACGARVRRGARGGYFDLKLRTAHYRVCPANVGDRNEADHMRALDQMRRLAPALAIEPPGRNGECAGCGFKEKHCRC